MTKPLCQRLSLVDKVRIQTLAHAGWAPIRISEFTKIALSTVRYWKSRPFVGDLKRSTKSGPKTPPDVVKRRQTVLKMAKMVQTRNGKKRPKYPSARSIAIELHVGRHAILRDLRALGLVCRVRKRVPTVYKGDFERRLRFVLSKAGRLDGRLIVFSDEKIFTSNDQTCRTMWVRRGQKAIPRESTRFPEGRVMVWAAIGVDFVIWRILDRKCPKKDVENDRTLTSIDADYYKRVCLPAAVKHCLENNLTFQQDGARIHVANRVKNYLTNKKVKTMDWPPRSPDLNPVETLWSIVQGRVSKLFPTNKEELIQAINDVFNHIKTHEISIINNLVDSYATRCANVRKANGHFA